MALSDAYCRVNRARGLDLVSPEDFYGACKLMEELALAVKLRCYESGALVLQLQSQTDSQLDSEICQLVSVFCRGSSVTFLIVWIFVGSWRTSGS